MSATLLLAAALMAQSAPGATMAVDRDLAPAQAYHDLAAGDPDAVKARIQANPALAQDDAAALINLGAAYARAGQNREALDCYVSAMASERQFEVRLGDGRWVDSRRAAQMAARALNDRQTLAMR